MCKAVEVRDTDSEEGASVKIYFSQPEAALPVTLEDGTDLGWVRWGQHDEQQGLGPNGGWIEENQSLKEVKKSLNAQPAVGRVDRYMVFDIDNAPHWFEVGAGQALKCLVIGETSERRVYLLTTRPPAQYFWVRDRWPLFVHSSASKDVHS